MDLVDYVIQLSRCANVTEGEHFPLFILNMLTPSFMWLSNNVITQTFYSWLFDCHEISVSGFGRLVIKDHNYCFYVSEINQCFKLQLYVLDVFLQSASMVDALAHLGSSQELWFLEVLESNFNCLVADRLASFATKQPPDPLLYFAFSSTPFFPGHRSVQRLGDGWGANYPGGTRAADENGRGCDDADRRLLHGRAQFCARFRGKNSCHNLAYLQATIIAHSTYKQPLVTRARVASQSGLQFESHMLLRWGLAKRVVTATLTRYCQEFGSEFWSWVTWILYGLLLHTRALPCSSKSCACLSSFLVKTLACPCARK